MVTISPEPVVTILCKRKSTPKRYVFDFFPLAATACYWLNRCMIPWAGFNRPLVTQEDIENRRKKALQLIGDSDFELSMKDKLRDWIQSDNTIGGKMATKKRKVL